MIGGVSADIVNQSNEAHAVNFVTLMFALVDRGVLSVDEIEKARAKAIHFVEQELAQKRDQFLRKSV